MDQMAVDSNPAMVNHRLCCIKPVPPVVRVLSFYNWTHVTSVEQGREVAFCDSLTIISRRLRLTSDTQMGTGLKHQRILSKYTLPRRVFCLRLVRLLVVEDWMNNLRSILDHARSNQSTTVDWRLPCSRRGLSGPWFDGDCNHSIPSTLEQSHHYSMILGNPRKRPLPIRYSSVCVIGLCWSSAQSSSLGAVGDFCFVVINFSPCYYL